MSVAHQAGERCLALTAAKMRSWVPRAVAAPTLDVPRILMQPVAAMVADKVALHARAHVAGRVEMLEVRDVVSRIRLAPEPHRLLPLQAL